MDARKTTMKRYGNIVIAMENDGDFFAFSMFDKTEKIPVSTFRAKLFCHVSGRLYEAETWEDLASQLEQGFAARKEREAERERLRKHWQDSFLSSEGENITEE